MTIQEAYEVSALAKAVSEARLGHVFLEKDDAVMIHDTDYTPEPKTEAEQKEMKDWVQSIMEKVLGKPLPREVTVFGRSEGQQVLLHGGHLHGRRQRAARLKPHLKIRTETPSDFGRGYCCRPKLCAEHFSSLESLLFGCSWRIMCSVAKATERKNT